ncbi:hypothetical protein HORIV_20190 [Vreelandella olivaria]|uniref:ABC transporter domain-containing protein n=1 Tax=Vreelandella olivaria TaxID=390919 RepID=A0ABN5WRN0_9GAMM|nr:hypothetical protein HORIV_20190 [Halomonas olivaria]
MAEPALSIRGLTKVYGNGFQALKGIDLDVQQGDFFALLGPNGAGKSTTLGVVCSLVQKTAGRSPYSVLMWIKTSPKPSTSWV